MSNKDLTHTYGMQILARIQTMSFRPSKIVFLTSLEDDTQALRLQAWLNGDKYAQGILGLSPKIDVPESRNMVPDVREFAKGNGLKNVLIVCIGVYAQRYVSDADKIETIELFKDPGDW